MGETENLQDGCYRQNLFMFDIKFLFFRLGPAAAYMPRKNIGVQQPMCQFVSKFVLETKFVPLFTKVSIVDKIETFQYGH